jgi:DNA-binding NarL/FixJ family response regulator
MLIDSAPDLTTVGEAAADAEAVDFARREQPDLVLMDIRMPEMDGIEAARQICGSLATRCFRVLILTTFDHDEYVYAALRAGASGFLLMDTRPARAPARALDGITEREREVLTLISRGLSNTEIISTCQISPATTRTHVGHLLSKLHARDRAQLVIAASETALVKPGSAFSRTSRGAPSASARSQPLPERAVVHLPRPRGASRYHQADAT